MKRGLIIALFVLGEAMMIYSHPQEAKRIARWVYVTGWHLLPKIEGVDVPDRFR